MRVMGSSRGGGAPGSAPSTAKRPASIQRMVGTELVHVGAPPGRLGVHIVMSPDEEATVHALDDASALRGRMRPGDVRRATPRARALSRDAR